MKILFVTPLAKFSSTRWIPLGLSYMASLLMEHGHTVRLYDRFLKGYLLDDAESVRREMKSEILRFKPDIIGFSTVSSIIYDTVECVKYVRDFYDGIVIAGGHHATAMPEITLQKIPGLDYAAAGEAEYTMLSLANGNDPSGIPGLFSKYTDTDSFSHSHIKDLDDLPFPEYKIFDMDYYTQANRNTLRGFYLRAASILTSRGCLNNCKFCSESLSYGKGVRFHSADYVIENIKKLVYDYKVEGLYLNDNAFLSSYSHAESICKKIIDHNLHKKIKWVIQAGTPRVNNDILGLLSKAGCVKIEFGIESIKDRDLKSINKHATTASNEKAISLCRENGIRVHAYFMTGFKDENISDLNNTLSWIKKHKPHTFSLHHVKVYPGTALYNESGDNFFEHNAWTRNTIENYFQNEKFSTISREKRRKWYVEVYRPFQSKYHTKALITANTLRNLFRIARKKYLR